MQLTKFNDTAINASIQDFYEDPSKLSFRAEPGGAEVLRRRMYCHYGNIEKTENGERWTFGSAVGTLMGAYLEFLDDEGNTRTYKIQVPVTFPRDKNLSALDVYFNFPRYPGN